MSDDTDIVPCTCGTLDPDYACPVHGVLDDEPSPDMSTVIRFEVHLPQPLNKIAELLSTLGELWPGVPVNTGQPGGDGWSITVPATGKDSE